MCGDLMKYNSQEYGVYPFPRILNIRLILLNGCEDVKNPSIFCSCLK